MISDSAKLYEKYGRSIPAGTVIFEEDDPGKEMYIIHEGKVRIVIRVRTIETTLAELGRGDFFGEMALLEKGNRSATAIAATDLKVLVLDEDTFLTVIRSDPDVALAIMREMAERLRHADERIETLLFRDATSKVVDIVSKLAEKLGTQTPKGIVVETTVEDIAGRAGLEIHKAEPVVMGLVAKKFLKIEGNTFIIRDLENMNKILQYVELKEQLGDII
jgi:CRP/FNR family transcriptional regulator